MPRPGERIISINNQSDVRNKQAAQANKAAGFGGSDVAGPLSKFAGAGKKKKAADAAAGVGGRTFAGEVGTEAVARRKAGFANVRPEQVPSSVQRGEQSNSIGILGAVGAGVKTRGGLSIN